MAQMQGQVEKGDVSFVEGALGWLAVTSSQVVQLVNRSPAAALTAALKAAAAGGQAVLHHAALMALLLRCWRAEFE